MKKEILAQVTVFGAGPAGIAAALQADALGMDTLLVERDLTVGGMSTSGLLNVFCGVADGFLFQQIRDELVHPDDDGHLLYDPEELSAFYYRKLLASGVRVLLGAKLCGAETENGRILRAEAAAGAGTETICSAAWIDATGDGLLASMAGVPYVLGDGDGAMQPMSMMALVGGVEGTPYMTFGMYPQLQEKMQALGKKLPGDAGHIIFIPCCRKGFAVINMTNCAHADGTDPWDCTRAQLVCREQLPEIIRFLRENVPGCENCFLVHSAAYAGIRESRHFCGKGSLTEKDILEGRVFQDWCVTGASMAMNIHSTKGAGLDPSTLPTQTGYTVPYSALVPRNLSNLLLSGRMISGTHLAHGSFRAMAICMGTGQAAGAAAALAVKEKTDMDKLPVSQLQDTLLKFGMKDPGKN